MDAARKYLVQNPLTDGQRVLALTKYHGSRRRMDLKLRNQEEGVGNALDCSTIDSFAWNLVNRWRSLANHLELNPVKGDFSSITLAAGALLQRPSIARWVARRYPLVVVDEMQDCKEGEVTILGGLEPHVRLLCGADAFQDLSGDIDNEAILWASEAGEVELLTVNHRTRRSGLLTAAQTMRDGHAVGSDARNGFKVVPVATAAQGGAVVCWKIQSWGGHGPIALISATAKGTSPFSDGVVVWASTKTSTSKNGATAGPYRIDWERSDDDAQKAVLDKMELPCDEFVEIRCDSIINRADKQGMHDLRDWARHQLYVNGVARITVADVVEEVGNIVRRRRAFGPNRPWRRRAMTIHQAKNREFESVIVLWPLRLAGTIESKRRLLYNAVTRARGRAIIVVQDPKGKVMKGPFFMDVHE